MKKEARLLNSHSEALKKDFKRKVFDMKRIIALLISLLAIMGLVACDESSDGVPEGMQLVYGSDSDGYYFYAPEAWTLSNTGNIKAAYVSKINTTSVSFAEVKFECEGDKSDYFFNSYFNEHLPELQKMKNFSPVNILGTPINFGMGEYAATKAVQYIYSYEYKNFPFGFMQILVEHDGRFYIFTYSAQNTAEEGTTPNYENHRDDLKSVIENFRFVTPTAPSTDTTEYQRDADGYILISDKKLALFDLYVPEKFVPDYSSAIVSATHTDDGSNISITKASPTGKGAIDYWNERKTELASIFGNFTVIQENAETIKLGNSSSTLYGDWDWSYEYTYIHEGKQHHVFQIFAINGFDVYVFTYTAFEENYQTHMPEVLKVIEKVRF